MRWIQLVRGYLQQCNGAAVKKAAFAHRGRARGKLAYPHRSIIIFRREMPYNLLVIFTGDVLGATQIFKKIKTDLKENRTLSIAEPPWPPIL